MEFLTLSFDMAREKFQVCLRTALETAHLQRFHKTITLSLLVDELAPVSCTVYWDTNTEVTIFFFFQGMVLSVLRNVVGGAERVMSVFTYFGERQSMAMLMITILFVLWGAAVLSE